MSLKITPSQQIYYDKDGTPLDAGFIYIGQVSQNPETNPVAVYWDSALTLPASQPIRTLNGYPSRQGVIANIYTASSFSITVKSKRKELVFTSSFGNSSGSNYALLVFPDYASAQAAAATLPDGSAIIAEGVSQGHAVAGAYIKISGVSADTIAGYAELDSYVGKNTLLRVSDARTEGVFLLSAADPSVVPNGGITRRLTDGRIARRQYSGPAMLRWWVDPASSDASAGIQAAFNSGAIFFDGEGATFNVKDVDGTWPLDLKNANFKKIAGSVDQINCISWKSQNAAAPVHHLSFENVHIDGNRVDERSIVALAENGGRSGFRFRGYVEHVRMKNCSSKNCGTDGVIMFAGALPGTKWPAFEDFVFEDCDFSGNRRHGLSYDTVRGLSMIRTKCKNNGNNLPGGPFAWDDGRAGSSHTDTAGKLYGNGVDGESYGPGNHSQNLLFEDCDMTGNARGGLLLLDYDISPASTGFTPWSDIKIVRGNYDPGLHSFDGSAISILRNGTSDAVTFPLRSFESLIIDEPYITGPSARIITARSSGAIKLSRTQDAYSSLERLSVMRWSAIDLQLKSGDRYYVDGNSRVQLTQYLTPASMPFAPPTLSASGWTVSSQSTARVGDASGVSVFAITANITTGGAAAATVTVNTGEFAKCIISGLGVFNASGVPIVAAFKVIGFSKTAITLSVFVGPPPATGKLEIALSAFDF